MVVMIKSKSVRIIVYIHRSINFCDQADSCSFPIVPKLSLSMESFKMKTFGEEIFLWTIFFLALQNHRFCHYTGKYGSGKNRILAYFTLCKVLIQDFKCIDLILDTLFWWIDNTVNNLKYLFAFSKLRAFLKTILFFLVAY